MVMLNQLKSGKNARIVRIENEILIRKKLLSHGVVEGSFVRVISGFGPIVFEIDKRIFSISKNIAEKIRVVELL